MNEYDQQSIVFPKLFHISLLNSTSSGNSVLTQCYSRTSSSSLFTSQHKCSKQKEIPLDVIYETMLNEYNKTSSSMPISDITDDNALIDHHRQTIIAKMKEFITQHRICFNIIFYAIHYLDRLIYSSHKQEVELDLDEFGLGALILAMKFNELEIKCSRLKLFQSLFNTHSFTLSEILLIEVKALMRLDYFLNSIHPLHFLQLIVSNGIVYNIDKKALVNGALNSNITLYPFHILEVTMEDISYVKYHPLYIAFACVALSRDIYHIDKWNALMENVFNVKFNQFDKEYAFVKHVYDNKTISIRPKHQMPQSQYKAENDLNCLNCNLNADSRYGKFNAKRQSDSRYSQLKSKSVEKVINNEEDFNNNNHYHPHHKPSNNLHSISKVNAKTIKSDHSSFFNVSELNPHNKKRNKKMSACNMISKAIDRSCSLHLSRTKEDTNHMPQFSKFKKESSVERGHIQHKHSRLMSSKMIQQHQENMAMGMNSTTLKVFSNLRKLNDLSNNLMNKRMRNIDRLSAPKLNKINTLSKSLVKANTNYLDRSNNHLSLNQSQRKKIKIKNSNVCIKLAKNSSCGSLKPNKIKL